MTQDDAFRVLLICSGNICRSPFAELLLRNRLRGIPGYEVMSAGTIARPGQRMDAPMVEVAYEYGIDELAVDSHRSARIDEVELSSASLILGLSREHRSAAVAMSPSVLRRAFTLTEFARLISTRSDADLGGVTAKELVAHAAMHRGGVGAGTDQTWLDIEDPIGQPREVFLRVAAAIASAVDVLASVLSCVQLTASAASPAGTPSADAPNLSFSFRKR